MFDAWIDVDGPCDKSRVIKFRIQWGEGSHVLRSVVGDQNLRTQLAPKISLPISGAKTGIQQRKHRFVIKINSFTVRHHGQDRSIDRHID